ncbi:integrase family protein [Halomonas rhizosphaerae]|uniref:Integrase family protein n=1 Tax=Halomonas rhizosphaerae TaxID=3043296 RepID=A0ABT6V2F6_9GAMM|nr:integrase family protein [Halomonas rhizosphaerae]MDI5891112.1 integrase family protein [Halomonas rhizosphaerae]
MAQKKHNGRSTDLTLSWLTGSHGEDWLQWQQYAAEWMATQHAGVSNKLDALRHFFFTYLMRHASYARDVTAFFRGHARHRASSEEFVEVMQAAGVNSQEFQAKYVNHVAAFIDHVIEQHYSAEDDHGVARPIISNPFERIARQGSTQETVRNPLPYRYIQQLRQILCPYDLGSGQEEPQEGFAESAPWANRHFRDWSWAHANVFYAWFEVEPEIIDRDDPDCVWRTKVVTREGKKATIHQMWSPITAMLLFVKLHLPLRTYQVRFLDSGEADTWRYEDGRWASNAHPFAYGSKKRPYAKGVFRRTYDAMTETYATALYVSTNKTVDQNKNEVDRGYTIPWQHEELLYWLEKLRNWQEKYNPIPAPVSASTLKRKHTKHVKSETALKAMGEYCFLFRDASAKSAEDRAKPISDMPIGFSWYQLLLLLEQNLAATGHALSDGTALKLVEDYPDDTPDRAKWKTLFPLHSLRVSLITAYTMDTALPLPVVSKLLAGHTRLLMTIYYNKITPSVMAEKMEEAHVALDAKAQDSLRTFLKDAELSQIQARTVCNSEESVEAAIANRNPIGWEHRATGLCLVGGNTVRSDELSTLGGCWNGGPVVKDAASVHSRIYAPVPHGLENCIRCRWFITDASYLPALNSQFNQISYKAHQAASLAVEIESELEALKDELFFAEEQGVPFAKHHELQVLERRYEKQRMEADEYAKDFIACFNLIQHLMDVENQRVEADDGQKLVAVGSREDLAVSMRFIETESELLHLSLLCEDAEFHPDLQDELRKTPAIEKRTRQLSRMMMQKGYQPIFMEMNERGQLIAANALLRKMAKLAHPIDKLEGYRIATDYIEARKYLEDDRLLEASIEQVSQAAPLTLPSLKQRLIEREEFI